MNGGEASLPSSPEKSAVVGARESPTYGIRPSGAGEEAGRAGEEADGAGEKADGAGEKADGASTLVLHK